MTLAPMRFEVDKKVSSSLTFNVSVSIVTHSPIKVEGR